MADIPSDPYAEGYMSDINHAIKNESNPYYGLVYEELLEEVNGHGVKPSDVVPGDMMARISDLNSREDNLDELECEEWGNLVQKAEDMLRKWLIENDKNDQKGQAA